MGMLHINGSDVSPHEMDERVLADELIWMERLLKHHAGQDESADRILNVADDALRYGNTRRPYWQSVEAFMAKHKAELDRVLQMDISQTLLADFRLRFAELFQSINRMHTQEPIEQFDVEFRQYLDTIASMIHELKYLASEKGANISLEQARMAARSSIVARAWDPEHRLSLVKQGTVVSNVEEDGSLEGDSKAVILEIGKIKKGDRLRETRQGGMWFLPSLLRAS